MNRIIIFTGKGGVGKSSVACAHGIKAAEMGLKTLIVSTAWSRWYRSGMNRT